MTRKKKPDTIVLVMKYAKTSTAQSGDGSLIGPLIDRKLTAYLQRKIRIITTINFSLDCIRETFKRIGEEINEILIDIRNDLILSFKSAFGVVPPKMSTCSSLC